MKFIDLIENKPHLELKVFEKIKKNGLPLMLFGAGAVAVFTIQNLKKNGIKPECFCDNNAGKQGKTIYGLPVYAYAEFKRKYKDGYNIIISTANMTVLYKWLLENGEKKENIHYFGDFRDPWSSHTDYEYIKQNEAEFTEAYEALADELSKKVFVNVLNCKLSGDTSLIDAVRGHGQYFDEDAVKLSEKEVFVDVGAFTGDTVQAFIEKTGGKYEKIIALEPDSVNYGLISKYIAEKKIKNAELHKLGAWHKRAVLSFADEMTGSSGVSDDNLNAGKVVKIEVDSIDNILKGNRASFIKMDIEGSERNALVGAEKTIKKWAPKIASSIYHKREDMFDILLLLKSYLPEYRFYVRNYSDTAADTVLYAVK